MYNQMIEQLQAIMPDLKLYPGHRRYSVHLSQIDAYLSRPDRDEEWAFTLRTAATGLNLLLGWKFDLAEQAFRSVLEQCGITEVAV